MAGTATLDQLRGAPAGASWWQNPALNRLARHPAIRVALIAAQSDADMRAMVINPGLQAANGLLAHPAARHIMTQTDLLYGQATYDGALDVGLGEALRQRRRADFINGDARRDTGAQREARRKWIDLRAQDLRAEGLGRADALSTARREAGLMDATHVLDMVAGGDPSRISGLGDSGINRSIGAQWRGRRADQLDAALEEQRRQGRQKPDITLEVC